MQKSLEDPVEVSDADMHQNIADSKEDDEVCIMCDCKQQNVLMVALLLQRNFRFRIRIAIDSLSGS